MHMTWVRRAAVTASIVLTAGSLVACQSADATTKAEAPAPTSRPTIAAEVVPVAAVQITPADATGEVRPDAPVQVTVTDGSIVDVAVLPVDAAAVPLPESVPLAGVAGEGRRSWSSTGPLGTGQTYRVAVDVADGAERRTEHASTFTTLTPEDTVDASITPGDGWTVGIGMPVVVTFDADVEDKAAVERRLSVETSPALEGAWRWESDQQVQWRPRDYWPSGTTATVRADLAGVEVAPGVWGTESSTSAFSVGSATVSTVDVGGH